jgi:hypothetical protein
MLSFPARAPNPALAALENGLAPTTQRDNEIKIRLKKGVLDLLGRLGVAAKSLEARLLPVLEAAQRHGARPTVAIAVPPFAHQRHLLRLLARRGVELALLHRQDASLDALGPVLRKLERRGLPCRGLRSAVLGDDQAATQAAGLLDLAYASSHAYLWPVMEPGLQSTLGPRHHASPFTSPVLPRPRGSLVELPVSLPDDDLEALPADERAGVLERRFASILERVRDRGECYVVRLTQRNLEHDVAALDHLLASARQGDPPVWIASLGEMTQWWQRKMQARIGVERTANGFRITRESPGEARFLVNPAAAKAGVKTVASFPDGWLLAEGDTLEIACPRSPLLAITKSSSPALRSFLAGEGLVFVENDRAEEHGLQLDWTDPMAAELEFKVLARVQCAPAPIVRLARWPNGCASALAITIELDTLKGNDFRGPRAR